MTAVSPQRPHRHGTLAPPIFVQRGATLAPTPPRPTVASRRHSCSSTYSPPLVLTTSTGQRMHVDANQQATRPRCPPPIRWRYRVSDADSGFGAAAGDVLGQRLTEGTTATRRPHRRRRRDGARFPSRLGGRRAAGMGADRPIAGPVRRGRCCSSVGDRATPRSIPGLGSSTWTLPHPAGTARTTRRLVVVQSRVDDWLHRRPGMRPSFSVHCQPSRQLIELSPIAPRCVRSLLLTLARMEHLIV